jgi:hypothetical protein
MLRACCVHAVLSPSFIEKTQEKRTMVTLIGSHEVADFEAWKSGSDNLGDEWNAQMGILDEVVYRTMDGNRVVVVNTFDTLENAEKFKVMLESPDDETRAMMEQGGIKFPVTVWIAEKV